MGQIYYLCCYAQSHRFFATFPDLLGLCRAANFSTHMVCHIPEFSAQSIPYHQQQYRYSIPRMGARPHQTFQPQQEQYRASMGEHLLA